MERLPRVVSLHRFPMKSACRSVCSSRQSYCSPVAGGRANRGCHNTDGAAAHGSQKASLYTLMNDAVLSPFLRRFDIEPRIIRPSSRSCECRAFHKRRSSRTPMDWLGALHGNLGQ
jgi:hypothetical protein